MASPASQLQSELCVIAFLLRQVAFAFDLGALGAGVSGALARPLASFLQPLIQDVVATALVRGRCDCVAGMT